MIAPEGGIVGGGHGGIVGGGHGGVIDGGEGADPRSDGGALARRFHSFDARVLQPLFGADPVWSASAEGGVRGKPRSLKGRVAADGVELEPLSGAEGERSDPDEG